FLPVRMRHYATVARQIRDILLSFTPLVEPLSLDEAFLDVRGCEGLFGPAPEIARRIRERVRGETGLVASVGVAPNKFLAKLASGLDDRFVVPDREAKSVSTETTFAHDIGDAAVLRVWLLDLVEQLAARLRRHGLRGRTVELKLRSSDFRTRSRSLSLPDPTD